MFSFALKKELGEVVFSLKIAYQAINTKLEPNPPGSYFNDVCTFASDIVRERNKHADRIRAERARRQQEHRQELQDAREAAETLKALQKDKFKVLCRLLDHRDVLKLLQNKRAPPPPASVTVSDGDQSDGSDTGSVIYVKAKPKEQPKADALVVAPAEPPTGEIIDNMAVDDPNEVRLVYYRSLLNRQVALIEHLLNQFQMSDAVPTAPPNTPKSNGESFYPKSSSSF